MIAVRVADELRLVVIASRAYIEGHGRPGDGEHSEAQSYATWPKQRSVSSPERRRREKDGQKQTGGVDEKRRWSRRLQFSAGPISGRAIVSSFGAGVERLRQPSTSAFEAR